MTLAQLFKAGYEIGKDLRVASATLELRLFSVVADATRPHSVTLTRR